MTKVWQMPSLVSELRRIEMGKCLVVNMWTYPSLIPRTHIKKQDMASSGKWQLTLLILA